MSPRTQKQFEEIRETRREQIMNAALELFAQEGYANCSIAQLATYAGISKGLMYNYFKSKEALLAAIIKDGMNEIMNYFDPNQLLTAEELAGFVNKIFTDIRVNQQFWTLYINIILQPRVKEFLEGKPFNNIMEQYDSILINYFTRMGFEDPALEMFTFSALIEGFGVLMVYAYPGTKLPDELLRKYEERVIKMFTKKPM